MISPSTCSEPLRTYIPLRNDMVLVCLKMQEVWTICRIFKRNITYKRQQQQVWSQPAAGSNTPTPADSSSHTGSFQSDGRDEYMNRQPPVTAPGISHHQLVNHQMNMLNGGSSSFFRDSLHSQQWFNFSSLTVPEQEQKPQVNPPAMTIACQQNPAANEFYRDSHLEDIARFMELSDPI
jgi:hypothetical protein